MEYLLAIGLAMLAGLLLTRLTKRFNLPDVTSYLIAGLLVGPLVLGAFGVATMWEAVFADVGVAFIAILNATRCLRVDEFRK